MKIYFGQIKGEYLESRIQGGDKMFAYEGKHYEFELEVHEDYISITDTAGRQMPIDFSDVPDLFTSLTPLLDMSRIVSEYRELTDAIRDHNFIQCV